MTFTKRDDMVNHWHDYAAKHLLGKRIVSVRYLTEQETESLGWASGTLLMELDDGTLLFPSRDDEGNGPGALFGQSPNQESLTFPVMGLIDGERPSRRWSGPTIEELTKLAHAAVPGGDDDDNCDRENEYLNRAAECFPSNRHFDAACDWLLKHDSEERIYAVLTMCRAMLACMETVNAE